MTKNRMAGAKKYTWKVQLQRHDGEMSEYEFRCNWDPNKDGTKEAVEKGAAVQAWWESGKKYDFAAIASALVEPVAA